MRNNILSLVSGIVFLVPSQAWSACDTGVVAGITNADGCTSVLDLTIGNSVRVSGLEDLDLTASYTAGAGGTFGLSSAFCLASNAATSTSITLESSRPTVAAGNGYNLGNAAGTESIAYVADIIDINSNSYLPAESVPEIILPANIQSDLSCAAEGFLLDISVDTTDADAAPAGDYEATLTLVVTPS